VLVSRVAITGAGAAKGTVALVIEGPEAGAGAGAASDVVNDLMAATLAAVIPDAC